jgi:hypothetical protein
MRRQVEGQLDRENDGEEKVYEIEDLSRRRRIMIRPCCALPPTAQPHELKSH